MVITESILITGAIILFIFYVIWLTTYLFIKEKYDKKEKVKYVYKSRTKVAIWFKYMFYSKLVISSLFAILLPEWIKLYYSTFLFDVFVLMYIKAYADGLIKKWVDNFNKRVNLGKARRQYLKENKHNVKV